jgi:hypothetical protein
LFDIEGSDGTEIYNYDQDEIDWEFDQTIQQAPTPTELLNKPHYGFNNQFTNYFSPLHGKDSL